VIEKRIVAAGEADFVICFYNPRSRGREGHLARAFALLAASKARTPVGSNPPDVKSRRMADHPRGDGLCPGRYDQPGDRRQQSDLHRGW
jgi:hypothetical protein